MKFISILCLLLGGIFFSNSPSYANGQGSFSDKFIFKADGEIFSLRELLESSVAIKSFECIYPDSLVVNRFSKLSSSDAKRTIGIALKNLKSVNRSQLFYINEFLAFTKLNIYLKQQVIKVSADLVKLLFKEAKSKSCQSHIFNNKGDLLELGESILRAEVFLRSRFLADKSNKNKKRKIKEAQKSIRSLTQTISKQVNHEALW